MGLPSGYTQLEYIESHGTEYFDTGFVPDGDSHVVVDFEVATGSFGTLFGARVTSSTNAFAIWVDTTVNDSYQAFPQYGNVVFNTKPIAINVGQKLTYELNKGVATVGGTTQTFTNQTFSAGCNLALFAINTNGVVDDRRTTGKLYSAKVYDNGTLIRDYIPCLNASGTVGLWDDVNGVFYSNAGSGTFDYHISKKHKTRIDSTGYETKSGRTRIDGTGYSIKKGRTLIGGTGYDISFGTPVGELDVGTSVYMDVDGVRTEFLVVHQGNPDSTHYDVSCSGTWVLMKDIYTLIKWSDYSGTKYADLTFGLVRPLAQAFPSKLDVTIQDNLIPIKMIDTTSYTDISGDKVFPLASYDISELEYFNDGVLSKRVAKYEGVATDYWLRDSTGYGTDVQIITSTGALSITAAVNYAKGFRPVYILNPTSLIADSDFNVIAP